MAARTTSDKARARRAALEVDVRPAPRATPPMGDMREGKLGRLGERMMSTARTVAGAVKSLDTEDQRAARPADAKPMSRVTDPVAPFVPEESTVRKPKRANVRRY